MKVTKRQKIIHSSIRIPSYVKDFVDDKNLNFSMLVRLSIENELSKMFGKEFEKIKETAEREIKEDRLLR